MNNLKKIFLTFTCFSLFNLIYFSSCYAVEKNSLSSRVVVLQKERKDMSPEWQLLQKRLIEDGLDKNIIQVYFNNLPHSISQDPMGLKIKELYTIKFIPKKTTTSTKKVSNEPLIAGYKTPGPWYKNIVTPTNTEKALLFLQEHNKAFLEAEKKYNVPKEVLVALLFVETRLGEYLGEENAFYTLASMASSKSYKQIPLWTKKLPKDHIEHKKWITSTMQKRSQWAYNELKALLNHTIKNKLNPYTILGSSYGAIGLCQFMPSNLPLFAVDGNGDAIVDLFVPADAIASAAHYLKKHKWNTNATIKEKVKVLKKYNNLTIYANTILALAESINKAKK